MNHAIGVLLKGSFAIISILLFSGSTLSQTSAEYLDQAVDGYNAMQEYVDGMDKKDPAQFNILKQRVENGLSTLNNVLAIGNADEIRTARYFITMFKYELGFQYGAIGNMAESRKMLLALEDDFDALTQASFPIRYLFHGKNYIINWDDFSSSKMEFYTGLAELMNSAGEFEKAMILADKVIVSNEATQWNKYIAYYQYLQAAEKRDLLDLKYATYLVNICDLFSILDVSTLQTITESGYYDYSDALLDYTVYLGLVGNFAERSELDLRLVKFLKPYMSEPKETDLSKQMLNTYDVSFLYHDAIYYGTPGAAVIREAYNFEMEEYASDSEFAVEYLNSLSSMLNSCEDFTWLEEQFRIWKIQTQAETYHSKAEACLAQRKIEEAAAAERARIEQERAAREARRNNRSFLWYTGLNVFPALRNPNNWGAVLNFGSKRTVVEFSYLDVKKKKENYFDLQMKEVDDLLPHKWDGYFTHLNFKFFPDDIDDNNGGPYVGFLLAYNQRTFEPFNATVTNKLLGTATTEHFNPTSSQVIIMYNMGFMVVKALGADLFFGVGGAYNMFNGGNEKFYNNEQYTIGDGMIANRKPNYWSFTMRMGISVGFGWTK